MVPGINGLAKHFTEESLRMHLLSRAERMPNGCLEYRGFGRFRRAYQKLTIKAWAHVAAYAVFVGPIDPSKVIDHTCENPPCIEPSHLRQVTPAENHARRRGKRRPASCAHEREIDPATGKLTACKPCNAEAQRRWRQRQVG